MAEVLSRFTADLEPLDEEVEPPPVEATEPAVAALAKGDGVEDLGAAVAGAVEEGPATELAVDCIIGAVAGGAVALLESDVVRVTCTAAASDVSRAAIAVDTMVGRVASFR
ncbi:MAG: hypothetical protein Q8L74_14005 [Nitrospirota bacterium]|nr:hypothetical protein [Nitrospirota bacterium]MDP2383062.1 hypothetical protein [Nitrospirota bacterium]